MMAQSDEATLVAYLIGSFLAGYLVACVASIAYQAVVDWIESRSRARQERRASQLRAEQARMRQHWEREMAEAKPENRKWVRVCALLCNVELPKERGR